MYQIPDQPRNVPEFVTEIIPLPVKAKYRFD